MPGVIVEVNEKCNKCGACMNRVYFTNVSHLSPERTIIIDECRECGHCVSI